MLNVCNVCYIYIHICIEIEDTTIRNVLFELLNKNIYYSINDDFNIVTLENKTVKDVLSVLSVLSEHEVIITIL